MKRILAVLMAVSVLASFAVAEDVTSVNAVGFIKQTVPDGGWGIVAMPLASTTGTVEFLVGDILVDAPDGTRAWFWRSQKWESETKAAWVGWDPNTNKFIRGDALFVNAPSGGGDVTYTVTGEVPSEQTAGTSTVVIATGWSLVGCAYPVDTLLTNSALGISATDGDRIWWWENGGWESATKAAWVGWDPDNVVLKAGQGYFFNASAGFDWTEVKPYVWP